MTAYALINVGITNPSAMREYAQGVGATVAAYGGEYLVRAGAAMEIAEGDWTPKTVIVIKFESIARANAWLNSPEYAPLKHIRHENAKSQMIFVEGV